MSTDAFLTALYVMVDDFCNANLPPDIKTGPAALLSRSEVVTLAIFGQWSLFDSERGFYRYAERNLRRAFPSLPHRSQFNRLQRRYRDATVAFCLYLVECLNAKQCPYEILDAFGVCTRNIKRRGRGWLTGQADAGWCGRLGGFLGFYLLDAVNPEGVITGYAFGGASAKEQPMADIFLALRKQPDPSIPSVGTPAWGCYIADNGFEGRQRHDYWLTYCGAEVISPRKADCKDAWSGRLWRWLGSIRQIIESVHEKLLNTFRLCRERPHDLTGFQARLAAKVALHNFCIWTNRQLGRPNLAFADLIAW